jgi:hypothetical protein
MDSLKYIKENINNYILPRIYNFDKLFMNTTNGIIINSVKSKKDFIDIIVNYICNTKENKEFVVFSCECGDLTGRYNEGVVCKQCKSVVDSMYNEVVSNVWISIPYPINYVLNPKIFSILNTWLAKKRGSITNSYIVDILDMNSEYIEEMAAYLDGKGFEYFYNNFDKIIDFFANKFSKTKNRRFKDETLLLLDKYKDRIFCSKLPIVANALHTITKRGDSLQYADETVKNVLQSILELINVEVNKKFTIVTKKKIEKLIFEAYINYLKYAKDLNDNKLQIKEGYSRQCQFGGRFDYGGRAVVSPLTLPVYGDEIHFPYRLFLQIFKLHIMNILINRKGYLVVDALEKINKAYNKFDKEIYECINMLIKLTKYKGIPILVGRNPSLRHTAMRTYYITKVHKNPDKNNLSINPLAIKYNFNMDFDGDHAFMLYVVENDLQDVIVKIMSVKDEMILNTQTKVNDMIGLAPQSITYLNNWLKYAGNS